MFVLAAMACRKDAVIDERVVTLYTLTDPAKTPQPASACAVPTNAYALYSAAGDFQPDTSAPPQEGHLLDVVSPELDALPATTRQLSLDVRLATTTSRWRGFGSVATSGAIDVLLWSAGHECELTTSVDARPGSTLTPYDDRHVLVAGGAGLPSFIVDFSNGSVTQLARSQESILQRSNATATAFSGGVVIAGGEYGNDPNDSAEIFDAQSGSFSGASIDLALSRSAQGATLLSNGSVLLVGGVGQDGAPYHSLQTIDPVQRHATVAGLAALQTARANPTVLRLASGEVLILGGTSSDGKPVATVEWFSSDATRTTGVASIASSTHQTFVALPAGGALAVISPDDSGPTTVWVLTPDHQVQQAASIASLPPGANVRLFDGADGAPLLWTGSNWFRWSPWLASFAPFSEATSADGTSIAGGPSAGAITSSPDSGLAIWLENDGINAGRVLGLRFDARGVYSTDVKTLLSTDTDSIAPDRLPTGVTPDASGSTLAFDSEHGLTLAKNSAVVIADATFAEFSLDLDTIQLGAPVVFLRDSTGDEFSIGPSSQATSQSGSSAGASPFDCTVPDDVHWHVTRSGSAIAVTGTSGAVTNCGGSLPSASRVTIGFRGRSTNAVPCTVRNLVVRR